MSLELMYVRSDQARRRRAVALRGTGSHLTIQYAYTVYAPYLRSSAALGELRLPDLDQTRRVRVRTHSSALLGHSEVEWVSYDLVSVR